MCACRGHHSGHWFCTFQGKQSPAVSCSWLAGCVLVGSTTRYTVVLQEKINLGYISCYFRAATSHTMLDARLTQACKYGHKQPLVLFHAMLARIPKKLKNVQLETSFYGRDTPWRKHATSSALKYIQKAGCSQVTHDDRLQQMSAARPSQRA